MTNIRSTGFLVLIMSAAGAIVGQAEKQESTIIINLTDPRGLKLPPGTLSIKSSQGTAVYSAQVVGQAVVHLPYGHYTVTFEAEWFRPVQQAVVIDKPECFVELAATFVPEGGTNPGSISIKVDPATSCTTDGSLWAKLVGVYSQDVSEQRVSSRGYALFEPVEDGVYVVIVVDGQQVRATLPVVTTRHVTTVNVSLLPCESR